jgi:hypothetical protein
MATKVQLMLHYLNIIYILAPKIENNITRESGVLVCKTILILIFCIKTRVTIVPEVAVQYVV